MRKLSAAALVFFLLAGCAAFTGGGSAAGSPIDEVRIGMSAGEVESAVGEPDAIEKPDADEALAIWHYYDVGVVILKDGKVAFAHPAPPSRI